MSPKDIDFDTYYSKHCARYYGWLPASKKHRNQIERCPKYFTLCGAKAIDVFMLEYEKLLVRDTNKRLPNVFVCEEDEEAWVRIIDLVRPPVKEAVIFGKLQDILTFEDDEDTRGRSPDEDEASFEIRKKLAIKGTFEQFKKHLPFDIINFDPWESLLNRDLEANKLYQAFKRIFELQKRIDRFLLFLTTEIADIHPSVQSRFEQDFAYNISKYAKIREALLSSVGTVNYSSIEENKRKALSFVKSVMMSVARSKGWICEHQGIYIYECEPGGTRMLSSVARLSKAGTTSQEDVYVKNIIRVIKQMPEYYSHTSANNNQKVKKHLKKIIEFRDKIRGEYHEEP